MAWIRTHRRTGVEKQSIVEAAGSLVGQFGLEGPARAAITAMRADGTFAFHNTDTMRQLGLKRRWKDSAQCLGIYLIVNQDSTTDDSLYNSNIHD